MSEADAIRAGKHHSNKGITKWLKKDDPSLAIFFNSTQPQWP